MKGPSPNGLFLRFAAALATGNFAEAGTLLERLQAHHPWLSLVVELPAAIAALKAGDGTLAASLLMGGAVEEDDAWARGGTAEWGPPQASADNH